jgi:hypothetical protein
LGDLRSVAKAKSFIFRLINYTYQIADPQIKGDVQKHINGGFIIAHHHSARKDGASGFYEAMLKSEKIVDEIIEKMIHDSNTGHPLFNYSLNTPSGVHVQPKIAMGDSGYSGWLCTFHIANFWRNCITSLDAPAWGDGGQTPPRPMITIQKQPYEVMFSRNPVVWEVYRDRLRRQPIRDVQRPG